jgi:hypothetical protein
VGFYGGSIAESPELLHDVTVAPTAIVRLNARLSRSGDDMVAQPLASGVVGDLDAVRGYEQRGIDHAMETLKAGVERWMRRTVHQRLEWWVCFNRDRPDPKPGLSTHQLRKIAEQHLGHEEDVSRRPIATAKKAAAKKKRKQAKAARKKGRKKKRR